MPVLEVDGVRVLECDADGAPIATERDAADIVGAAFEARARLIAIPTSRLDDTFFRLASGLAGAVLQKFVTYHLRVAVLGDIADRLTRSEPLRAFVDESNRGRQVWFLPDAAALAERPRAEPPAG